MELTEPVLEGHVFHAHDRLQRIAHYVYSNSRALLLQSMQVDQMLLHLPKPSESSLAMAHCVVAQQITFS